MRRNGKSNKGSLKKAVITILSTDRTPLTIAELLERTISAGLFVPTGRTPDRSLHCAIFRENQKYIKKGQKPIFVIDKRAGHRQVRYSLRKNAPF